MCQLRCWWHSKNGEPHLTPHASAILLEPEYGLPAAKQRAKSAGLLLAYEQIGYNKRLRGCMPRLLEGWTVKRLGEAGGIV